MLLRLVEVTMPITNVFARRTARALLALAALGLSAIPSEAAAQVVRGVVVDQGTGRGVAGVVVVLFDSTGLRLAGVLADNEGRYAIRTTLPGRYGVRAERIGFRAAAPSQVTLRAGETVELRLAAQPIPVLLTSVRVTTRSPCVARAEDGQEVSAVWEEARKALYATDLTQRQELFSARMMRFERMLDARTRRVTSYDTKQSAGVTRNPFVSLPAARLSADGYVRQTGSETVYYGPDAAVLLSDEFLGDHCFRLRAGDGRRAGLIGLEFEPVRGRQKADIAGTLWIDRRSAELRDLEYSYRNLPNLPRSVASEDFGGRIEFHRMPTGAWIVEKWVIRMPVLVDRGAFAPSSEAAVPGQATPRAERVQLGAIREEGGEVLETTARGERREVATERASLRGVVFDSTRMAPLVSARVFLDGTQFATRSTADGSFVLENLPDGAYAVSVVHPRFDSLGVTPPGQTMTLQAGTPATVTLAGPSTPTVLARICTAEERAPGTAAIRGRVVDATGAPAVGAEIAVTWPKLGGARVQPVVVQPMHGTRTDSAGRYDVCGLPEGVRVTVRARSGTDRSTPTTAVLAAGELGILDIALGGSAAVAAAEPRVAEPTPPPPSNAAPHVPAGTRGMQEVERRRRRGSGSYLTRTQIDRANVTRFTDLLRVIPGISVRPDQSGTPIVEVRRTARLGRGAITTAAPPTAQVPGEPTADRCPAEIRLDGLPVENSGLNLDSGIQPRSIEVVEVYSGAQTPVEFAARRSTCGLVLVWTRMYAERVEPTTPE